MAEQESKEKTTAEFREHLRALREQMIQEIDKGLDQQSEILKEQMIQEIDKGIKQFKDTIKIKIDFEVREWGKKIYDRAWQKGKNHF